MYASSGHPAALVCGVLTLNTGSAVLRFGEYFNSPYRRRRLAVDSPRLQLAAAWTTRFQLALKYPIELGAPVRLPRIVQSVRQDALNLSPW